MHPFSRISSVKQEEWGDWFHSKLQQWRKTRWIPLCADFVPFPSGKEFNNIWLWQWKIYFVQINAQNKSGYIRVCMDVLYVLEGFQSYWGHPRISLFLLFSASSHSMRGWKYCMSGWALILDWPVIMAMASGQGLLNPSFIKSLQKNECKSKPSSEET